MPDLYVNSRLTIPEKEISVTTARSSGPGGQNVNKVNSKITLRWSPEGSSQLDAAWCRRFTTRYGNRINREGQLVLHSEQYRDQIRNLADVRGKLVSMLLECQSAPKARRKTRPTKGSQRRRLDHKREQSEKKRRRQKPSRDDF
ncbi:MAG: alternative ribosome rescue aminoacyl-tRNA hydrolase ArfB [Rubripirellula sp.]|nr:alternative ribosome rescue aminoacyl-tRNA hydrolase ArfB [Rubripirellula sp.]